MYIGVELILGVGILNKAGGAYGVLSLLTGHPINFWQWLYNLLAIATLPFYISALSNLMNRANNVRKVSLACVIYTADTLVGILYTIYFIYFWFSREDNNPASIPKIPDDPLKQPNLSQSATPGRELFFTASTSIFVTAFRIYCTLVVLSFTRALLKQDANSDVSADEDADQWLRSDQTLSTRVKHKLFEVELKAKEYLRSQL